MQQALDASAALPDAFLSYMGTRHSQRHSRDAARVASI